MIFELFKFTMIAGIITGFAFIIYTNLSPKRKDKSIIYLNFFVFFFTLNNLQITLADYNFIDLNFFERKLLIPFYALIIPAFYTFVTYYLKAENKIKSFVFISIFFFVIELIVRFVLGYYFYNQTNNIIVAQFAKYEEMFNLGFTIFLFLKVIYIFMQQAKYYEEIASYDNMKWLKKFLIYGFGIIIFWVFAVSYNFVAVLSPNIPVYYPLRFSSTLLVFWIAYYGFFKYNLLTERIELRKIMQNDTSIKELVKTESTDKHFNQIQNYIIDNKLYLNPDLYKSEVAQKVNLTERNLSQILLKTTNNNFSDYINSLRVEKAKIFLTKEKYKDYTVEAIGFECGFNSRATFYRAFEKFVKISPIKFRQLNQK